MHILGTAGHVDHGKSALVRALTGTDPDRWKEEQLRGMTLDLGFAHLRFDDGVEAGIVDVPGHERFLHNMLAGAAGMEILLLVVAANEGPRPQTHEHLAILSYLNVRKTLLVLTKRDLVDADELAFAEELTREALRGTLGENAPAYAVSTITGDGLEQLRAAIHDALVTLAPRKPDAPAFLPIDRVFALSGHGTIVTGTLMQGTLRVGETLRLQPSGRDVRIRSLHVFGQKRDPVQGGSRVAANLPQVNVGEIERGEVLASPEFTVLRQFEVTFTPLAGALPLLRRRNHVRAYLGSAEILGTLAFEEMPREAIPVRGLLSLRRAAATYPGEAFVVRRLSPKDLLGGGTVGTGVADSVESPPEETAILGVLASLGLASGIATTIAARANLREERTIAILEDLVERGAVRKLAKPVSYVENSIADELYGKALAQLSATHRESPWRMGLTSVALAKSLDLNEQWIVRVLATYVDEGRLDYRNGYYAAPGFTPEITSEQRAYFDTIVLLDRDNPLVPVPFDDVASAVRTSRVRGTQEAFETLLATGALVKVQDALYRGTQIAEARARVEATLRKENTMTMARFRDVIGTSRKYAVPLLEWFDAAGVTIRSGDVRTLRNEPI
ncbi:MAG: selenocysteine-specific translation elongation factor, partial [Candidatus Eremiobacteraeota bacterium]|nr:selenocysteine-specific translation elongation factor [Candidatus Eremiobacteraeota bacterium]